MKSAVDKWGALVKKARTRYMLQGLCLVRAGYFQSGPRHGPEASSGLTLNFDTGKECGAPEHKCGSLITEQDVASAIKAGKLSVAFIQMDTTTTRDIEAQEDKHESELSRIRSSGAVTISPELFERVKPFSACANNL